MEKCVLQMIYQQLRLFQFKLSFEAIWKSIGMKRNRLGSPTKVKYPKCLVNDSLIQNARPYQVEILEQSVKESTIVCLGTGTGKTFISVMLIREKQGQIKGKLDDGGKRTFFLVNTVPLAEQQAVAIKQNTSLKVRYYTGDMGVDFWKKEKWRNEFDNEADVFVMTAQILVNILTHGFFSMQNINLLIMDECHNATKKHPYVQVMTFMPPNLSGPHVMGLTASIINEKYKKSPTKSSIKMFLDEKMKKLECTLRAKCITCSDPESTSKYAAKPVESIFSYSPYYDINEFDRLNCMIVSMKEKFQNAVEVFEKQKKGNPKEDERGLFRNINYTDVVNRVSMLGLCDAYSIALDTVKFSQQILESLGPMSTYDAIEILLEQLDRHKRRFNAKSKEVLNECSTILKSFAQKYEQAVSRESFGDTNQVIPMEPFITEKAHKFLKEILLKEKKNFAEENRELHSIVFVQRRCTAIVLSKLINRMVEADPNFAGISSEYVLGHGFDENIRLADSFMKSTEQSKILNRFKAVEFNVLVATSVVEEGLDVRKCNLVVRFDGMNNYREYAQSKGRARQKDSKFIVMAREDEFSDTDRQLKVMQKIESVLFEECQDRDLPTEDEIREQMYDEIDDYIETIYADTGHARIKPAYAVSLLYRYCAFLQHDIYSSTNPEFNFTKREDRCVKAECILPLNFPLEQKKFQSDWMPDKETAKKHVASKICQLLKDAGELTKENLLPINHRKDNDVEDSDDITTDDESGGSSKAKKGTRKARKKVPFKIPDVLKTNLPLQEHGYDIYLINMMLTDPADGPSATATWPLWFGVKESYGIILPTGIKEIPPVTVYNKSGRITVQLVKLQRTGNENWDFSTIKRFNELLCHQIFKKFLLHDCELLLDDKDGNIFKGLIVPLTEDVMYCFERDHELPNGSPIIDHTVMNKALENFQVGGTPIPGQQLVVRKTYITDEQNKRLYYVTGISEKRAGDFMEGKTTFVQYYQKKYGKHVNPDTCLLEVVPVSSAIRLTDVDAEKKNKKNGGGHYEELVPDLCEVSSALSAQLHMQANILPYVLYRIGLAFNAEEFKNYLISTYGSYHQPMDFESISIFEFDRFATEMRRMKLLLQPKCQQMPGASDILEAITTRQALLEVNLERLEMLGDAFLKQAVSIYLFYNHPTAYNEGRMTRTRKKVISNKNLVDVAKNRIHAHKYINNSHFGDTNTNSENTNPLTVWLPPSHRRKLSQEKEDPSYVMYPYQEVQDKSLADCVEALIGVFFKMGGVGGCLKFMDKVLGIPVLFKSVENEGRAQFGTESCYADFPKPVSAVRHLDHGDPDIVRMEHGSAAIEEGYQRGRLRNVEKILGYTFKDKSHLIQAMTHASYRNFGDIVTGCYEVYEFLGDSILDFLVTLNVYTGSKKLSPGRLTSVKSALVNNSVFSFHVIRLGLHKYLQHSDPKLFAELKEFTENVTDEYEKLYMELYESPFIVAPPNSECGLIAPKVLGDVFESLAGAIFLDSGLDILKVWEVFYPIMADVIEKYSREIPLNPKREMHERFSNLNFDFPEDPKSMESELTRCVVTYGNNGETEFGVGKNKKIAKIMACQRVLKKLKARE